MAHTLADEFLDDFDEDREIEDEKVQDVEGLAECLRRVQEVAKTEDEEYDLVMDALRVSSGVEERLFVMFRELRDEYRSRFPELETLLYSAVDYARVVKLAGNCMDLSGVDLGGVLSPALVITVTVTASKTSGAPLSEDKLASVNQKADNLLQMEETKRTLIEFVESRTATMAPNTSAIVGTAVAAQLMGLAGGLQNLASMPACNIQVIGAKKRDLAGMSTKTVNPFAGVIYQSPVIQGLEPETHQKASRIVAAKTALAARVDACRESRDGHAGAAFFRDIEKRIEKWNDTAPAKTAKPLPVPGEMKRKKRGGRRFAKQKEVYAMTEMRKQQNRVGFGVAEEIIGNDFDTGLGMLGAEGSKKLRVQAKATDSVAKAANRKLAKVKARGGSGAQAAGLTTSLAFTTVQGIELGTTTPAPGNFGVGNLDSADGTKTNYFSSATPFMGSKPN